jgi:hypothetical protein
VGKENKFIEKDVEIKDEECKYNEHLEIEKAEVASIEIKHILFSNIPESTYNHNSLL